LGVKGNETAQFAFTQGLKALNLLPKGYAPGTLNFGKNKHGEKIHYLRLSQEGRMFFVNNKDTHKVSIRQVGGHDYMT
jgi:hypothetical protein